jgi:hypothetical protein
MIKKKESPAKKYRRAKVGELRESQEVPKAKAKLRNIARTIPKQER